MRNPRKSHLPQISKPAKPEKLCACLWQFSFSPCQLGCFTQFWAQSMLASLSETTSGNTRGLGAEDDRKKMLKITYFENLQNQSLHRAGPIDSAVLPLGATSPGCSRGGGTRPAAGTSGIICYRTVYRLIQALIHKSSSISLSMKGKTWYYINHFQRSIQAPSCVLLIWTGQNKFLKKTTFFPSHFTWWQKQKLFERLS